MPSMSPAWSKRVLGMRLAVALGVLLLIGAAVFIVSKADRGATVAAKPTEQTKKDDGKLRPTAAQWTTLTVQPVEMHKFRIEHLTEGKIAVDEDRSTAIFSVYAGRVTKLLAAPGDTVQRGQPLFVLEAADTVQVQNDFIAALTAVNKTRSQLRLAEHTERRLSGLYEAKAMPLKDWQEADANLAAARNDLRTVETTLEAMRNRLRILGKSDAEIATFERTGVITPDTIVSAPLAGTVVQRKVGPGQYVAAGASDPVFVVGDLSTVWLVAFVREAEASKVKVGQPLKYKVLAYPDRVFEARISYVATALEPNSRRLMVRATIDNAQALLKPEMFASVMIAVADEQAPSIGVPREAIIYDGDGARVWVATADDALEARQIKTGLANGRLIQVLDGLKPNDRVVTRGTVFVDRAAAGS